MIAGDAKAEEYWHVHRSDCRNRLIYAHTNLHTLPACNMSLGSQTLPEPEARDVMQLLLQLLSGDFDATVHVRMVQNPQTRTSVNNRTKVYSKSGMLTYSTCLTFQLIRDAN